MEFRLPVVIFLLLLLVLVVALPVVVRRRCLWRSRIDWERHAQLLVDEGQFQRYYKIPYASFMALANKLAPFLSVDEKQSRNRTGIEPISHINKLHMGLRWLSEGSYHDVRTNSDVSVGAFYAAIHQVVDAIIAHPDLQLQFPATLPAQRQSAYSFKKLSNAHVMKGCVGVVDGWLCPIRAPRRKEVVRVRSFFSGHYQRYEVNVQAYSDHLSRFTAVTCSSAGGTGDAVAFLKWRLSRVVNSLPNGLYVVGDNAYTNSNHLLTPFPRPRISTAVHDSYNFHLSQLRIRIEMALVCKWRIFKASLEISFKRVPSTILAACILHNSCINQRLRVNGIHRVEEDEDLVERIEEATMSPASPQDFTVEPQDTSCYRQLYESSDLSVDTDTYNSSEWVRDALVGLIEDNMTMRPTRNRATRVREAQENQ